MVKTAFRIVFLGLALIVLTACTAESDFSGTGAEIEENSRGAEMPVAEPLVIAYGQDTYTSLLIRNILLEAYSAINIPVTFQLLPAEESLPRLEAGEIDGEMARVPGVVSSYSNIIQVPAIVHSLDFLIVTRDDHRPVMSLSDLGSEQIGLVANSRITIENTKGYNQVIADSTAEVISLLDKGEIDAAILERYNTLYELMRLGNINATLTELPLFSIDLYHYLHRSHADLVPRLSESLLRMNEQGDIQRIIDIVNRQLFHGE
jgi:polar amino acid transport system substrate-binding protein